jgi:Mrp family chromosome partitioning ATPase
LTQEPRQSGVADYIAVLRRRGWIVALLIVVGAGAALAISLTQDKTYTAEAAIRTKNPSESLGLVGLNASNNDLPAQLAAQGAQTVTQKSVIVRAIGKLGLDSSFDAVKSDVSASQDVNSNLIHVSADAPTSQGAADLANAVADAAVAVTNGKARHQYAKLADQLHAQAQAIKVPHGSLSHLSNQEQVDVADANQRRQVLVEQAAKMQALSTVAQLAQVAQRATPPDSPSAPKPARNAVIGGGLGLLLGLGLIGLLESVDRRLRTPEEAEEAGGFPYLGLVPEDALGDVPDSAPTHEHIVSMNAFQMMRTNVGFLNVDNPPKSLLVTSPLPQEGKTTVSIGIALAGAAAQQRTLLIEADLHRPVHAERLGLKVQPGLADYLSGSADLDAVVQSHGFADPAQTGEANGSEPSAQPMLSCITAGTPTRWPTGLLGSDKFRQFIAELSDQYELVVIDSGPLLAVPEASEIVTMVDCVVFCLRLGHTTIDQARRGRQALERLPARPTALAITGISRATGGYGDYAYTYAYARARSVDRL